MKNHGSMTFRSFLMKGLPVASLLCVAVTSCEDEFEDYYSRPGWLEKPAVDVLAKRGDCDTYLQLVDKTLFSKQLEGSGSYTFFVPTDEAFEKFWATNPYGYKSVDDIPEDVAADIVSSTMLYNQYPCDSLGNVLVGYNTWERGAAYKHRTPAYEVLYKDYVNGDSIWVYDDASSTWTSSWHNYRYLPVFTNTYFSENGLTAADYNKFYDVSESSWSQFGNVLGAQILDAGDGTGDLYCQSGVIHMIDKVVLPPKNIDRMIVEYAETANEQLPAEAQGGAWSAMKQFLYHQMGDGTYQFLTYTQDVNATHYYEKMYPDLDLSSLSSRVYSLSSPFALNIEEYTGVVEGSTTYASGLSLFLPTDSAMNAYINNRILAYVDDKSDWSKAFNGMSESVLPGIMASLMADGIIWPSHYENAVNTVGSYERIDGGDDGEYKGYDNHVKSSGFASNGLFHIIDFFPKTAAFEGVGARFMLDPDYSIMEQVYTGTYPTSIYANMLTSKLSNYGSVDYTVILQDDQALKTWDGVNYDAVDAQFENADGTSVNSSINAMATYGYIERDTMDRLDLEVDPLNGAYGGWAYTNTYNGEVIRYKRTGNTVQGKPEIMVQSAWSIHTAPDFEVDASAMPQSVDPAPANYASVIKDPTYDGYVNGNVYVSTSSVPVIYESAVTANGNTYEADASTISSTLTWYLYCDSLQATPRHSLFKKYWELAKGSSAPPAFTTGLHTVLVPTDAALNHAIAQGLMIHPDKMASTDPAVVYADTAAAYLNPYIITTDCLPDDGASNVYSTAFWKSPLPVIDISNSLNLSTSYKPLSNVWEDLMSGTTKMSIRFNKVGDTHELRFLGKDYVTLGGDIAVRAYNAAAIDGEKFSNTVVRELGQSNIIANNGIIHSLNGYIVYKIQPDPDELVEDSEETGETEETVTE